MPNLKAINLSWNNCIKSIGSFIQHRKTNMDSLNLSGLCIPKAELKSLRKLEPKSLYLNNVPCVDDSLLDSFGSLDYLSVAGTGVSGAGLIALVKGHKIGTLNIKDCNKISHEALQVISKYTQVVI